jgi:RNA polymerase sigma-70 factor (ECF subfamily)
LEAYRDYLTLLARLQLRDDLTGKIDLSGVVQQTFLDAWRAAERFPSDADQQAAWLRLALAHNLTDEIRRLKSRGRRRVEEQSLERSLEQSSARLAALLANDGNTPRRDAIQNEELARLAWALLQLPDDQRRAVELHHLQGISLVDTGRHLGLGRSREAAAGLIFRGLKTLRSLLTEKEGR